MPLDGTEGLRLPVNRPMLEKAKYPINYSSVREQGKKTINLPYYCSFKKIQCLHLAVNPKLFTGFSCNFSAIQGTFHLRNCCFSANMSEAIAETVSGRYKSDQGCRIKGDRKEKRPCML